MKYNCIKVVLFVIRWILFCFALILFPFYFFIFIIDCIHGIINKIGEKEKKINIKIVLNFICKNNWEGKWSLMQTDDVMSFYLGKEYEHMYRFNSTSPYEIIKKMKKNKDKINELLTPTKENKNG